VQIKHKDKEPTSGEIGAASSMKRENCEETRL